MADPDLQIRGERSYNIFFRSFGPQVGLKIRRGDRAPWAPPTDTVDTTGKNASKLIKLSNLKVIRLKGAVSRKSSLFCLILPVTRPQLLWNFK